MYDQAVIDWFQTPSTTLQKLREFLAVVQAKLAALIMLPHHELSATDVDRVFSTAPVIVAWTWKEADNPAATSTARLVQVAMRALVQIPITEKKRQSLMPGYEAFTLAELRLRLREQSALNIVAAGSCSTLVYYAFNFYTLAPSSLDKLSSRAPRVSLNSLIACYPSLGMYFTMAVTLV